MSPPTWTPDALRSEARPYAGRAWRMVEAQHRVSTLKLVDSLAEQQLLEDILEATKPPLPAECRGLDYLLATPFRYRPYPAGSRFRRAGLTPGVWYGAEAPETAAAEMVFYRFLFHAESPGTPFPDDAAEYTGFAAELSVPLALDLTSGGLAADRAVWMHPTEYAACQDLAETARGIGAGLIRYASVRDPAGGANLAVLTCRAFAAPQPVERQTWRIRIGPTGAQALREHPPLGLEYPVALFAGDPRLAALTGEQPGPR
ncbi:MULTISPECIES: RES family NAD+ phosphorylase [unclassified Paracoccus (in: a-proteobacteria)]|uniref:RES family NAD+ phosphorylase n=1 Tax=unclassified Paracoccus (in: a-proteobacteria) TaxID=2688777 RepID=UPI0021E19D22|nr:MULTISPECIES: RES family NAD+ phosphorylase [unclassified Paracoccus (in: a-proteobacteria)]UXU75922.1 RES family NAD+ phosphorylase [Paracoccus sp. SMMA_5]UXU81831.1 RES family NAD+ phosphorylase [Paracoccus sp. SMMA_5_TC]